MDANSNERRYYVVGVPEFIIVDRNGKVRGVWNGFGEASFAAMTAMVETCIAEPPPAGVRSTESRAAGPRAPVTGR
jgi:hypothetical protein